MEVGPFGPWREARTGDELTAAAARPLSGSWYDEFAVIYEEAYAKGGTLPADVDRQSIVDVAIMLGRNRAREREPWPDNAPSISAVRRNRAFALGLPRPEPGSPIGDDEYDLLLAEVRGGTRR